MRKIRELLRLHFESGLGQRLIAQALKIGRSTVERVLQRFIASGLLWPLSEATTDAELQRRLYGKPAHSGRRREVARPDYAHVASELKRKGVTRRLLWEEYRAGQTLGIGYSVFCEELAGFLDQTDVAYRNDHVAGQHAYFDFAGMTLRYMADGVVSLAQIFVAVLGYSNYTFARAYADQTGRSWLDGQRRAFEAFGGVPQVGVPDNPKALVTKTDRYEPQLARSYEDFAAHYGIAIVPARVRNPKDKSSVEGGVKFVEMRVLAKARDAVFPSLEALVEWLDAEMQALNEKPFQKRAGTRATLLAEERGSLNPLPLRGYEFATFKFAKVARDYHVQVGQRLFSVPHQLVGKRLEIRITTDTVEVFDGSVRVAAHSTRGKQRFVTESAHMPVNHRAFRDPQISRRAQAIGPNTEAFIDTLYAQRRHPEQAIRSAMGVLRLAVDHSKADLELACEQALRFGVTSYLSLVRIIKHPPPVNLPLPLPRPEHEHIRGGDYYAGARHAA